MNINNILNYETFENDFVTFDVNSSARPVIVTWGGTGIHSIAGPTPLVDISKSFNTNEIGVLESIVNTINLTGKIIKPSGIGGITTTVSAINALDKLFRECSRGALEITCDGNTIFSASGVSVKNIAFNKTSDNWVQSADYTIDLEYKTAPFGDSKEAVTDRQETWSIEPLDDVVYTKYLASVNQKPETFNPNLRPRAPSFGNPAPPTTVNGGLFGSNNIQIFNMPQFRITRRLSAKGLSLITPAAGACLSPKDLEASRKGLFLSAKAWVDKQSSIPFNGGTASGAIYFTDSPTAMLQGNTWLYNHTRSISTDIYNGTYEANDTWIAMPTGIPYIETFTIDATTDLNHTKTVRIAGNIQGLHLTPSYISNTNENPGPLVSGTRNNVKVDLSGIATPHPTQSINYNVPSLDVSAQSSINKIESFKYTNALEAWTKDIKPYLYRRASMGINSPDRKPDPAMFDPSKPKSNPIYATETPLNINPVSSTEGHDPIKGIITYNHEFNNQLQFLNGVLSENIRISHTAPASNIQETQILGRALGPLLSSAGVSNPRKTISVDIVVPKNYDIRATLLSDPNCPLYYLGYYWTTIDAIIRGNEPFANRDNAIFNGARTQPFGVVFKDSDSEDWNPTEGRYSRSVSWTYQQCTTNRFYLDH